MRRLLALAFVALAFVAPTPAVVSAQDTQAAQDTAQVDEAPPLPPLVQLTADLAAIAARIDEVEENLAAAPPESQAVFTFQRRTRWTEHHEVLGRLVEGIEREQATAQEDSPVIADADSLVADADSLVVDADSLVLAEARSALQRELVTIEASDSQFFQKYF